LDIFNFSALKLCSDQKTNGELNLTTFYHFY
jgi:hypothetical protein